MAPQVVAKKRRSLIYLDREELATLIKETRKEVMRRRVHPPSTKTRLLTSHAQAYQTIDDLLFLAEIVVEQKHGDTFPDEWKDILAKASDCYAPTPDVSKALELISDFTEFKGNRIPPDNILSTILNGLKIR